MTRCTTSHGGLDVIYIITDRYTPAGSLSCSPHVRLILYSPFLLVILPTIFFFDSY